MVILTPFQANSTPLKNPLICLNIFLLLVKDYETIMQFENLIMYTVSSMLYINSIFIGETLGELCQQI